MKIFHRIVLSVFTLSTFGKVVHADNDKCHYDGHDTNHGDSYTGDSKTCECNNGKWKNCYNNSSDCTYQGHSASHGDSYEGDTQICDCVNGRWRNCRDNSNHYVSSSSEEHHYSSSSSDDQKKCKRNGNTYDVKKWHSFNNERCYCDWNGEFKNCEGHRCERNGNKYDANKWHSFNDERCYCDWNGQFKDCEGHKCERNGNKYDINEWHSFNDERCYCDWNGEFKDCESSVCHHGNDSSNHGEWYNFPDKTCRCEHGEWIDCAKNPTKKPTRKPTKRPTKRPSKRPTRKPTRKPTKKPTKKPNSNHNNDHCESNGKVYAIDGWHDTNGCRCQWGNVWNCDNQNHDDEHCSFEGNIYNAGEYHNTHDGYCKCQAGNVWTDCRHTNNGNGNNCWSDDGEEYSNGQWYEHGEETCTCGIEHGSWWWYCEYSSHHNSWSSNDSHDVKSEESHDEWCETIAEFACGDDNFSILCAALKRAHLLDTLDNKNDHLTFFAPNNNAFKRYLDGDEIYYINSYLLEHVLKTNLVDDSEGVVDKEDLKDRCGQLLKMANGKYTRTLCTHNDGYVLYQKGGGNSNNDKPKLIQTDIKVCNGIIHEVDEVILP